jgi:hypothetical protein
MKGFISMGSVCWMVLNFKNQLAWSQMLGSLSYQKLLILTNERESQSSLQLDRLKKKSLRIMAHKSAEVAAVSSASTREESHTTISQDLNEEEFMSAWYKTRREYNLLVFLFGLFIPILIPPLVIHLSLPYLGHGCLGCYEPAYLMAVYTSMAVLWSVFAAKVAYSLRAAPDPLHQIRDMKFGIAGGLGIGGVGLLLLIFDQVIPGTPHDMGMYNADWFILVGNWITYFFFGPYPMYVAISKTYRRKHRMSINFKSVLPNHQFQAIFTTHLINEWSVENLKFWIQVNAFRTHYGSMKQQHKERHAATQLFETFVQPGAVMEVNLPESVRRQLEAIFDNESQSIEETIFDKAQSEAEQLMERDSFLRFKDTKVFKDWAKDNILASEDGVVATAV